MTTFDKREEGFEKKYALDEEQKFKAEARRNRLLGLWAAEKLGLSGDAANTYAKEVVAAEFEEAGDADVVRKVMGDLTAKGVAITEAADPDQDGRTDGGGHRAGEGRDVIATSRHSGACRARTRMCNCTSENLEHSGSPLRAVRNDASVAARRHVTPP